MNSFSVTILGSSSALPTAQRFPTSQVVRFNEQLFLVDCGEGAQIQLRKFGFKMGRINHIFISHLHGDHIYGLPGMISSLVLYGKKGELHIHAHSDLQLMMEGMMKFMNEITDLKVIYHPLNFRRTSVIFEDRKIRITSFPLKHRVSCCGFLFQELPTELHLDKHALERYDVPVSQRSNIKNGADLILAGGSVIPNKELTLPANPTRSYAFCTDTIFKKDIVSIIAGADLLYHEATFSGDLADLARKTFHSTSVQAAELAKLAGVKKLVIGHFSSRYKSVSSLLEEARAIFPETLAANDGDCYDL
ncbi:MAG: ribonuclease Z [Bacteroidetes bacterium]|nr:ribonuclease Z [Bacteroidota bacterium]